MDTDVMERVVSLDPISLDNPSSYLIFVFIFLVLAFIAGLLIILLSRKNNKVSERPPVFGAETTNETEPSPSVDMSVPGAEDLTLSQKDISVQPVPHLGHPDDEGVPVPKYDEEEKTLVVDTDVAPVDVNADVPVAPIPAEASELDSAIFVWHTPEETPEQTHGTDEDTVMNTIPEPTPENLDATLPDEAMPEAETVMPEAEEVPADADPTENVMPEPETVDAAPSSPLDSIKTKFEEVKDKTVEFFEGEGEDAPIERIKRAALDAKDKAYEAATSERAQEIRSSLEAKAEEAKEKATELWEKAKESAQDEDSFLGQAKRKALSLKDKADNYFNKDNPPKHFEKND